MTCSPTSLLAGEPIGRLQVQELCRRHGISGTTFFKWKAKYGGLEASDARRLRSLEDENRRPKTLLAEQMLDNAVLKDLISKSF